MGLAIGSGQNYRGWMSSDEQYPGDLDRALIEKMSLAEVEEVLSSGLEIDTASVTFLPPFVGSSKMICVGLNYVDHSAETGFKVPDYPTVFPRFPSSLIGHLAPIIKPVSSDQLDYEGEVAVVLLQGGRYIPQSEALSHVLGYSIFNDASVRDFQLRTPQWTIGKNFDGTGAFGPSLVTADELPAGAAGLSITTRLNGAVVQKANTNDLVFSVAKLISDLSQTMTLEPGDAIITGTPAGVGAGRKPPLWMKDGDVCEVEVEGIGVLRNTVRNEQANGRLGSNETGGRVVEHS
ncbi:fumarylacetoacetate hydrolase family protein [Mesorhizobium sp. DCY119]|uniref:fumarylacetoacetate hydrolase family protein n=1 Tax=Mesorhizobium sp. DCY119 TaxID=2108445 RepID=UPI001FE08DD0|nr:fumarylacetoacetate hydrolase family protein [Mesorhizobium sp. DCY119]